MKNLRVWGLGVLLILGLSLTGYILQESPKSAQNPSQKPFEPVDTNFRTQELLLSPTLKFDVLYRAGDLVYQESSGMHIPSKDLFDFLAYLPIESSPTHGNLWVNHESLGPDLWLGDGGGATVLEIQQKGNKWETLNRTAVDFTPVGGTAKNCLGAVTPWGTVITSEEFDPTSNYEVTLYGLRDTTPYQNRPRWQNYGWMVEVDPVKKVALRKLYGMGRFMHEAAYCMPDKKTVYLLDDRSPGIFFKFVATTAGDYGDGQLYAYQQSADGESGKWLKMPMEFVYMVYARQVALQLGATIFIRLEDFEPIGDGTFILSETGYDNTPLGQAINLGGNLAKHLVPKHIGGGVVNDPYGRLLRYDPKTEKVSVLLECGIAKNDPTKVLSNPDNLAVNPTLNMVVICEDMIGTSLERMPAGVFGYAVNEVYTLDLSLKNPTVDDLQRLAVCPNGCEPTGPAWSPDYSTLFFNLQHPSAFNPLPYNRDLCIAVTGWKF